MNEIRGPRERPSFLPCLWSRQLKTFLCKPEKPQQTPPLGAHRSWSSKLPNCEKPTPIVHVVSNLIYLQQANWCRIALILYQTQQKHEHC